MSAKEAYPEILREFHRMVLLPHELVTLVLGMEPLGLQLLKAAHIISTEIYMATEARWRLEQEEASALRQPRALRLGLLPQLARRPG